MIATFAGNFQLKKEIGRYLCGEIPCHKNAFLYILVSKFFFLVAVINILYPMVLEN
jgi:hypothetical protein